MTEDLFDRIEEAHRAIRPQVAVTPLTFSPMLSAASGCQVYLKCEHLQHTGSFKFRGATNKVRLLDPQTRRNGILTVSSGNHGQGVALAGKLAGVPVTVYAASTASPVKLEAIRALGAEVVTLDDSNLGVELEAARQAQLKGMKFVSPYNDLDVIAGQGTIGIEIHEQARAEHVQLAAVFASVGGGGLISGVGTAVRRLIPGAAVVGCWPANSTALYSSLKAGKIVESEELDTISDGTAGGIEPDTITFDIGRNVISDTTLVTEEEIKAAMKRVAQTDRWMVEGAAGVALASMLKRAPEYQGRAVAVILCGRNIVLEKFIEAVQ
ncbi:threonine dehydratase [Burkholderia aenigmatica]|uniref:Threonine dehydratase n=1 Tax=Burkholderia aenigmatica TaxID=2015348 RepID=A0A6P2K149_9BURK|nr:MULTISPECIES: threonine/serine dehydratase [Burkholderia]MDN7516245.1 threonine/serine dehydratase [Burkholderia sp. AU45251]VWB50692.1 threonine dehydratase [Burkholderia aenigmatica]HDR9483985.1 threonine/serine dehydratase [Burkholderia aenigmatica]HDR9514950.1 threonine/serine dehydratase [Burkholderia aenigmatica]HDR9592035.1 threonine/serine dehydratase [Burkholderia aenigmatica]